MKNKRSKMVVLALSLCLFNLMPVVANAQTFQAWSSRGVMYLSYSKNTLSWSAVSSRHTSMDAWQTHSGFFVSNEGYTKLNKSDSTWLYVQFKNRFLAGAVIGGQSIGYDQTKIDQICAYTNGYNTWALGI